MLRSGDIGVMETDNVRQLLISAIGIIGMAHNASKRAYWESYEKRATLDPVIKRFWDSGSPDAGDFDSPVRHAILAAADARHDYTEAVTYLTDDVSALMEKVGALIKHAEKANAMAIQAHDLIERGMKAAQSASDKS